MMSWDSRRERYSTLCMKSLLLLDADVIITDVVIVLDVHSSVYVSLIPLLSVTGSSRHTTLLGSVSGSSDFG